VGHFQRVGEVGLSGGADLPAVLHGGEDIGAAQELHVRAGHVLLDFLLDVLETDQGRVSPAKPATPAGGAPRNLEGMI
jgi:hypothetical protein